MTRLRLVSAVDLEVGQRFRYQDVEHTVERLDGHGVGEHLIDVHVDDRDAPVTLFPFTLVTLVEGPDQ